MKRSPYPTLSRTALPSMAHPSYLRLRSAESIHPHRITRPLLDRHGDWTARHQLRQERVGEVVLRVVPTVAAARDAVADLEAIGRDVLGEDDTFRVEVVEAIEGSSFE